jgi:Rrf2 family iron-sulfur cluster assembly transcriptional regulator
LDLQLTKRGDYAVRAAVSLARASAVGGYRKIREIAAEMAIPERYTHEILTLLVRGGLVEALAGKQGGYKLRHAPVDVTLLQVIEAAEGPLRLDRCALSGGPCHWQGTICAVHPMLEDACNALTASMRSRSLADILAMDERLLEHAHQDANRYHRRFP